jgi:Sulfotransferase family
VLPEWKPAASYALRRFRRSTSRVRLLPAFLIIGTQPAAAVPLFNSLRRHPDVSGPSPAHDYAAWSKELHFFDQRFALGVNWYRACFPLRAKRFWARRRGDDLVAGEATASYFFHPKVPERVAATIPEVRLIALLRNPVERAYWHYESMRRKGVEPLSFEEALASEEERMAEVDEYLPARKKGTRPFQPYAYVARGLYGELLERWLAHFPREQLLAIRSEDFLAEPRATYSTVLQFLGLREWQPRRIQVPEWKPAPLEPDLRASLEQRFAESNARVTELLGSEFTWSGTVAAGSGPSIR